jgi:hypothetical protein
MWDDLADHIHHICHCLAHVASEISCDPSDLFEAICQCFVWHNSFTPSSPRIAPQSELENLLPSDSIPSKVAKRKDQRKRLLRDEEGQEEFSAFDGGEEPRPVKAMSIAELNKMWEPGVTLDDMTREEALQAARDRRDAEDRDEGFGRFEAGPSGV